MQIEETFPDHYKNSAYHPSRFVYAWKRKDLEKLFEELMKSNIAILKAEAWLIEDDKIVSLIPLKTGEIDVFNLKNIQSPDEEWFDFVERSIKDTAGLINYWDLDKNIRPDLSSNLFYNFTFSQN